jgi:hypothetical protein
VVAVWACWSYFAGRVPVTAPAVSGTAAKTCSALHSALPGKLLGQSSRTTTPSADTAAAWGDPALVLRCGVAVPAVLDPSSRSYDPTVQAEDINGVCWVDRDQKDGSVVFTTVKQQVYVELTVPKSLTSGDSPLPELTSVIAKHDPSDPGRVFDCS